MVAYNEAESAECENLVNYIDAIINTAMKWAATPLPCRASRPYWQLLYLRRLP